MITASFLVAAMKLALLPLGMIAGLTGAAETLALLEKGEQFHK